MGKLTVMFKIFLLEIKESRSKQKIGQNLNNAINRIEVILCSVCEHVYLNIVKVLVGQSRLTLCDHVDCSLPGSSAHGIFQARTLEWIAIPFSRGSS